MYFTDKIQIEISFPQLILKTKVIKFLKRMFCLGGFCPGGFWQGGFLSRGFLSGGLCPGGFCLGGFCPRTGAQLYARFSSEHTSSPAIFAFFTTLLVIMDYVRSDKGGMKLLFQNNLYVKQKVLSSGAVCWECDRLL